MILFALPGNTGIQTFWWPSVLCKQILPRQTCRHSQFSQPFTATYCIGLTLFLCRESAPKVSHSSCTRSLWPRSAASRTAVQPSWGKGAIVDCDTTNRRGVSGVWHKVFIKSRLLPNFSIWHYWPSNAFVWVFPLMLRCWYNFFFYYFYYTRLTISIPKSSTYMEQTHKHTICYFLRTPTT